MKYLCESLKVNQTITKLNLSRNRIASKGTKYLSQALKLTKSVKDGNFQLFQELIQIEKIPLIYQSSSDDVIDNPNNQEENNTIFHTAIFHNQTEFLFYLLFANNEKTDQEIISKRNLFLNFKNSITKKSAIDLLTPNQILIQDFKNYYNQFISQSSSSSSSSLSSSTSSTSSYFNNNEKSNNIPNKLIAEKEIILMRIGKEWKTIKNEFQNELTQKQKQLFLKWLYCPVSLNFQEKQIILEVFKLLNIIQFEKQSLFSNDKLLNDFQNYIKKYANSEKKVFQINLEKKKEKNKKKKNENQNDDLQIKSVQINKFVLCLRSDLFREMIFQTFPFQVEIEKEKEKKIGKKLEREMERKRKKRNEIEKKKRKKNNQIQIQNNNHNQTQNNNHDNNNNNNDNNVHKNNNNININNNNKPTTKNTIQKSSEHVILTITKAKTILKNFNQNNINNLINFFLETDVSELISCQKKRCLNFYERITLEDNKKLKDRQKNCKKKLRAGLEPATFRLKA
ncbi:protein rcc2 [Anaeramoeba flamelloides]|uniref:Protein rcc2 n=1 Tax=Anaeramoeba flamelloides TaxID=1746091 RepID=A0AAV7ZPI2_9EUKA|nr:protein rcc2 [Anaeramoeba flamelloides]